MLSNLRWDFHVRTLWRHDTDWFLDSLFSLRIKHNVLFSLIHPWEKAQHVFRKSGNGGSENISRARTKRSWKCNKMHSLSSQSTRVLSQTRDNRFRAHNFYSVTVCWLHLMPCWWKSFGVVIYVESNYKTGWKSCRNKNCIMIYSVNISSRCKNNNCEERQGKVFP